MSNNMAVYDEKRLTVFQKKRKEIIKEIKTGRNNLQNARDYSIKTRNEYESVPWYRPFKKAQLKKEYRHAMDNLVIANSEALIQQFKILGYILALIVLALFIPADAIIKTRNWVIDGFDESNEKMANIAKAMTIYNKNKRPQKSGINISRGFFRLFIVCIVVAIAAFGIHKARMHKKDATNTISTTNSQINQAETIEAVKNMMAGLKSRISTLKETFFGSSVTDEEIYFEAIEPEYSMEAGTNVSPEEIEDTERQQTTPEILEQKTVEDENKLETSDTISQTENSTELSGKSINE